MLRAGNCETMAQRGIAFRVGSLSSSAQRFKPGLSSI